MIPAVIFNPPAQREQVTRLVQYCRELDGTELVVVEPDGSPQLPYPQYTDQAFHQILIAMDRQPFMYLEADSVPLKAGWLTDLDAEFTKCGKTFMLTSDSNSQWDRISGIGCYGPEAIDIVPYPIPIEGEWFGAWDGWILEHGKELLHRTPLIRHSYGRYDSTGRATPHRFPQDRDILRSDAVIFHADKFQDLIL